MLPPKVTVRETTPRQTQAISEILSKDSRWSQNTGTSTACPSANSVSVLTRHAAKLNYKFERWPPSYPMVTFAQGVRERSAGNVPLNGAARYSPSGGVFRRGNPSSIFSKDQIRCYHPGAALFGERRKFSRLVPLHPPRSFPSGAVFCRADASSHFRAAESGAIMPVRCTLITASRTQARARLMIPNRRAGFRRRRFTDR
jgi:hypothetical protein